MPKTTPPLALFAICAPSSPSPNNAQCQPLSRASRLPHTHPLEPPSSRRCQERINFRNCTTAAMVLSTYVVPTLGNYHTPYTWHSVRRPTLARQYTLDTSAALNPRPVCRHPEHPLPAYQSPGGGGGGGGYYTREVHNMNNEFTEDKHVCDAAYGTYRHDACLDNADSSYIDVDPLLSSRSTPPDHFRALPIATHPTYALRRQMHAQYPNSHRLRIDAVHPHPASTSTSHLSTTRTIARSACAVGGRTKTAAVPSYRALPSRIRRAGVGVRPSHELVPHAHRVSFAGVRSLSL
ncbi:hypothetical protein B0H13DRAFT_2676204 [Mycena leptocephala]|nr:hypothetical protein B0H13DRAFT_2676204 [Mycena leptocephala]